MPPSMLTTYRRGADCLEASTVVGREIDVATTQGVRRMARVLPGVVLLAVLLVLAGLAPASAAAGGPTSLRDPGASPDVGVPTTTITLTVTYENREGSAPDYVRVVVGGKTWAMRATKASESYKKGVKYTVNVKLPVGRHATTFEASDRDRFTDSIAGPTVTIKAPAPTPMPEAKPKPEPTAAPSARPRAVAPTLPRPAVVVPVAPAPTAVAAEPARGPLPRLDPESWSSDPDALLLPGAWRGEGGSGPTAGGGPGGPGGPDGGASLGGGSPFDGPGGTLAALVRAAPVVVATTGAVTLAMAFLAFGKRRRDEEPTAEDDVLARAAATGMGIVNAAGLVAHAPVPAAATVPIVPGAPSVMPLDTESHLPRWRRPSLLEARKADPTRSVTQAVRLTFDADAVASTPEVDRRVIRYRLVSLLDLPDEVRGREIGVLDEGDEVALLEKHGTYWRVRCPDGREGWLHKMTLGDTVIGSAMAGGETWTSGDNGPTGFEDVLRAYKLRRGELPGT